MPGRDEIPSLVKDLYSARGTFHAPERKISCFGKDRLRYDVRLSAVSNTIESQLEYDCMPYCRRSF